MKKIIYFIMGLFLISCHQNETKLKIIVPKVNMSINDTLALLYIINSSHKKIYLSLDEKRYDFPSANPLSISTSLINQIIKSNEVKEEILYGVSPQVPKLNEEEYDKIRNEYKQKQDSIEKQEKTIWFGGNYFDRVKYKKIISPYDTLKIPLILWLKGRKIFYFDIFYRAYEYEYKPKNTYTLQYSIKQSKKEIESLLTQKEKDSLKKENIEIFDGVLYSNKIPLQIK